MHFYLSYLSCESRTFTCNFYIVPLVAYFEIFEYFPHHWIYFIVLCTSNNHVFFHKAKPEKYSVNELKLVRQWRDWAVGWFCCKLAGDRWGMLWIFWL